jgi:hypothetical protein
MSERILRPFPEPPPTLRVCLEQLDKVMATPADKLDDLPFGQGDLNRPWDPAACHPEVRQELWQWLDDVAGWLNETYCWSSADMIPDCWPRHPHIAIELADVACARVKAYEALTVDGAEDFHRYTLPSFYDRMRGRLQNSCKGGNHADWPGANRHRQFLDSTRMRQDLFAADIDASEQHPTQGEATR